MSIKERKHYLVHYCYTNVSTDIRTVFISNYLPTRLQCKATSPFAFGYSLIGSLIKISTFSPLLSSLHSHPQNDPSLRNMTILIANQKIPLVHILLRQKQFLPALNKPF